MSDSTYQPNETAFYTLLGRKEGKKEGREEGMED
jgi:hypothetical protein